jgi:hypothetical protein
MPLLPRRSRQPTNSDARPATKIHTTCNRQINRSARATSRANAIADSRSTARAPSRSAAGSTRRAASRRANLRDDATSAANTRPDAHHSIKTATPGNIRRKSTSAFRASSSREPAAIRSAGNDTREPIPESQQIKTYSAAGIPHCNRATTAAGNFT